MTKELNIVIELVSGGTMSFKYGQVVFFQLRQEGMIYLEEADVIDDGIKDNKNIKTVRYIRHWIPNTNIKKMAVITKSVLEGKEEILKYETFKKYGIDMTRQAISGKGTPSQEEINKEIEEATKKAEAELKKGKS